MKQKTSERRGFPSFILKSFHLAAVIHFVFALYYDSTYVHFPSTKGTPNQFGGKLKYLTILNVYLQVVYYFISLLNDFIGSNDYKPEIVPTIRKVKDYLFSSLCFPISLNVGISFWGIYIFDRELVCPKMLDDIFPIWLNHMVHTNIMIFITLELLMLFRKYPSKCQGLLGLLAFMGSYLVWIHIIKHISDDWVYPILEVLPMPVRFAFFAGCIALAVAFYFLGHFVNDTVWYNEIKSSHHKLK